MFRFEKREWVERNKGTNNIFENDGYIAKKEEKPKSDLI